MHLPIIISSPVLMERIYVGDRRTSASSRFLLKIRHGCRTETLSDGIISVTNGFDYQLTVDAEDRTLCDLHMQFGKFPIGQHDEFVRRYYDTNS